MVIWELKQVGDLFPFYGQKGDAAKALREYRKEVGDRKEGRGPEKLIVRNRDDLIALLERVAGSAPTSSADAEEDDPHGLL